MLYVVICSFDILVFVRTSNILVGRKKRVVNVVSNLVVKFNFYKCFFDDCIFFFDFNIVFLVDKRFFKVELWSDKAIWNGIEFGWGGYNNGLFDFFVNGDNVKILEGIEFLKINFW